jgi:hypothetical protein
LENHNLGRRRPFLRVYFYIDLPSTLGTATVPEMLALRASSARTLYKAFLL